MTPAPPPPGNKWYLFKVGTKWTAVQGVGERKYWWILGNTQTALVSLCRGVVMLVWWVRAWWRDYIEKTKETLAWSSLELKSWSDRMFSGEITIKNLMNFHWINLASRGTYNLSLNQFWYHDGLINLEIRSIENCFYILFSVAYTLFYFL